MRIRLVVLFGTALIMSGCGYNTIQTLDEQVNSARQQIEVQMQRRADLVPNLVETVRGYAAHEEAVFTGVAEARSNVNGALQSGDAARMAVANSELTSALSRLMVVAEAYPELKADQAFLRLQDELTGTENRIAVARTDYNKVVQEHNTYVRRFPAVLTAKVIGAKQREYFEATREAVNTVPTVSFTKDSGG